MVYLSSDETTQEGGSAGGSAGVVHAKNALKAAFKAGFYDHLWHEKRAERKAADEIKTYAEGLFVFLFFFWRGGVDFWCFHHGALKRQSSPGDITKSDSQDP